MDKRVPRVAVRKNVVRRISEGETLVMDTWPIRIASNLKRRLQLRAERKRKDLSLMGVGRETVLVPALRPPFHWAKAKT